MQQDAHGNLLTLNVSTSSVSVAFSASGVMGGSIFLYLGWLWCGNVRDPREGLPTLKGQPVIWPWHGAITMDRRQSNTLRHHHTSDATHPQTVEWHGDDAVYGYYEMNGKALVAG